MPMMKLISLILAASMFSNVAFATCDFSTGISKTTQGYLYTPECHIAVGQLVEDNKTKDIQLKDLGLTNDSLKLALQASDARTQLWMDTTFKLEKNINAMDELKKTNEWVYFGLGALTVIATGFALSSVTSRR
jgi:hypothetical protein